MMDLLLHNLRTIGTHHCDQTVGEEAAAEIEALRAEVERLRADLMESDEIREKLGHLLTRTAAALKGDPPAGVWHSWHDLPEKAAQLVERVQRDEALLRQALEALEGLFGVPDQWTGAGAGGVAVWRLGGADSVRAAITALRERLGEKA